MKKFLIKLIIGLFWLGAVAFVWQAIGFAQTNQTPTTQIPYCEFGRDPVNTARQLEPGEVWIQLPANMGPVISMGGSGGKSKPCIVPKGTMLGAKKTEGSKYCEPWAAICGNPLLLPDGRSFCFSLSQPTPPPNTPTPPPAPIPAPEPNTSTTVKVEPSTIKVEPSTIKVEVEVKQAPPPDPSPIQPSTSPDGSIKKDKNNNKKIIWGIVGAVVGGFLLGYLLSQQGNDGGGHAPGGGTVPPGGGGPPGGGTVPP